MVHVVTRGAVVVELVISILVSILVRILSRWVDDIVLPALVLIYIFMLHHRLCKVGFPLLDLLLLTELVLLLFLLLF